MFLGVSIDEIFAGLNQHGELFFRSFKSTNGIDVISCKEKTIAHVQAGLVKIWLLFNCTFIKNCGFSIIFFAEFLLRIVKELKRFFIHGGIDFNVYKIIAQDKAGAISVLASEQGLSQRINVFVPGNFGGTIFF